MCKGVKTKTDNSTKILNSDDGSPIYETFKLNDIIENQSYDIPLIQLYSPTLCPILVEIVENHEDLI